VRLKPGARLLDARRVDTAEGLVRVAVVVPKYSYTAVRRNKLKRRLRELTRAQLFTRPASCDLVLRARLNAYAATFDQLRADVERLATQLA
jgi:ribonuclease P protein component